MTKDAKLNEDCFCFTMLCKRVVIAPFVVMSRQAQ